MLKDPPETRHMSAQAYHRPLIPILFCYMGGIIASRYLPVPFLTIPAWILSFFFISLLVYGVIYNREYRYTPLLLLFTLGWLAVSGQVYPAFPPKTVLPYLDQGPVKISGTVYELPVNQGFRTRYILSEVTAMNSGSENPVPLPGRIQLTLYGKSPEILPGYRITMHRSIRSIRNFNNPGGFDYRQFMAFRGIWGTAWDNGNRIRVEALESPGSLLAGISKARIEIDHAIAYVSQGDTRAVLAALLIGKRELIRPELRESFSRAGVSHLLAISGLHVGIVATVTFYIFSAMLGRSTFLLKRAMVRRTAAFICIWFVIGYGILAGMSPSTQRAVIMVCLFLFSTLFEKQNNMANTLAAAALGILAVSPQSLFDISFQLSFSAVSAIFFGLFLFPIHQQAATPDKTLLKRFMRILKGFVWVSLLAILGTTPLVAHYFNHVTVAGLVSNLILVPIVGFVVVPLGLLSVLIFPIATPVSLFGFRIADTILDFSLTFITWISGFKYSAFNVVTPSTLELVCIYALLITIPLLLTRWREDAGYPPHHDTPGKNPRHADRFPISRKAAIKVIAVTAALIMICDISYWVYKRFFNTDLTVTFLNVGNGNAALIEIPGGKTILVDGGGFSDNATFDVGGMVIAPFLWRNKIQTIDKMILSHPHTDHLNGLLFILENFRVNKVVSTHFPAETRNYKRFLEIIDRRGIPHPMFANLQRQKRINGVKIDILYPPVSMTPCLAPANLNNGSIVMRFDFRDISFLFPGDLETAGETALADMAGKLLESTFLLSPHHGSNTSSTPLFIASASPETVIISASSQRYEFPASEVLERYAKQGCTVYKTERDGAIRVVVNKTGFRVKAVLRDQ